MGVQPNKKEKTEQKQVEIAFFFKKQFSKDDGVRERWWSHLASSQEEEECHVPARSTGSRRLGEALFFLVDFFLLFSSSSSSLWEG